MPIRRELLSNEEIQEVREHALREIAPLKPAATWPSWGHGGKRTVAGESLPAYYLVHFLLVELLGFGHTGPEEKVAWTIGVDLDGSIATIEHRKLGLGIFSPATPEDEAVAKRIVRAIQKGVKVSKPFFDHLVALAMQRSALNVINNSRWLFARYEYLRDHFRKKLSIAEARKDEVKRTIHKRSKGILGGVSYSFPGFRLKQEADWTGIAAIEAFFSWTEHVLIHIAILQGKLTTGKQVEDLAVADWSEKVRVALDLNDIATKQLYDELTIIRRQIRNYIAHGAFGKQGEAFDFHSKAGAVPVTLTDPQAWGRFSVFGAPSFDEAAAIRTAEEFVANLWSGPLAPAKLYVQEAELPIILTYANNGTYRRAMASSTAMEDFVRNLSHQMDEAANMDW